MERKRLSFIRGLSGGLYDINIIDGKDGIAACLPSKPVGCNKETMYFLWVLDCTYCKSSSMFTTPLTIHSAGMNVILLSLQFTFTI